MARRVPVKTALVGLLFAPGAMAQQPPDQNAQAPDPTPPPTENKPADPNAAPATMQPVTVTGSRPERRFPDQQGLDQPPGRLRPDGRAAVGRRHQQGADGIAGRDLAAERHPQRARHHHRRRRRRDHRQQFQHQRLLGPHRPLSRRHARPRPVLPRRLRAGCDRGPVRPGFAAVRPRLDRRCHQPGDEEAGTEEVHRPQRLGHDQRPRARHGRRELSLSARTAPAPRASMPCSSTARRRRWT